MNNTFRFNPQDLNPDLLYEALKPLSHLFIPKRRLRINEVVVGVGGFGTVKLAELWSGSWLQVLEAPVKVAVKELRTEKFSGEELRMAFRLAREMRLWASCKHENILEFTGYYISDDFRQAYLISPYMENGNLKEYLAREAPSCERRLELVLDTLEGLSYLHTQNPPIVHGDLKPLNVLVNTKGKALLSDFGLAKALASAPSGMSTSDGFKGTVRYCSPEALHGSPRDHASDIWAWGCLSLEIITDKSPYHECQSETQVLLQICGPENSRRTPEPSDLSSIPLNVLQVLRKCWSFEPNQRPNTERCLEGLETFIQLLPLDLPVPLFVPQRRLSFMQPHEPFNALLDPLKNPNDPSPGQLPEKLRVRVRRTRVASRDPFINLAGGVNQLLALKHEHLEEIVGYFMDHDLSILYLVSPCIEGKVMWSYLQGDQPTLERRLILLRDILRGLEYLHSSTINMVHGALDPWTVRVNDGGRAVISDICLDCAQRRRELMQSVSTASVWCSPEVLGIGYMVCKSDGTRAWGWDITGKADIWSWACLVLQVICGKRPFEGHRRSVSVITEPFSSKQVFSMLSTPEPTPEPILPGDLLALVRQCWNSDPDERPSAAGCLDSIDRLIKEGLESAAADSKS